MRFCDVCVHEFTMGDVDDLDIYIAGPIWDWQQSELGSWVIKNAEREPYWVQNMDVNTLGYRIRIMARFSEKNEVFWRLKWGGIKR